MDGCIRAAYHVVSMGMTTTTTPPLTPLEIALAATFKGERNAAGLSLDDMADRTGMNRMVYYRLETAQRHASMAQIEKVADALGLSVNWLIKDATDRAERAAAASAAQSELQVPAITSPRVTVSVPTRQAAGTPRTTDESSGPTRP